MCTDYAEYQMTDHSEYARALTDYQVDGSSDELSCSTNDIVKILQRQNRKFYAQNLTTGRKGFLPSYCVKSVILPVVPPGKPLFFAIANYDGNHAETLSFEKGDFVIGDNAVDSSWWFGWRGAVHGLFPVRWVAPVFEESASALPNHVDDVPVQTLPSQEAESLGRDIYQALEEADAPHGWTVYPFQSGVDGELDFQAGEMVYLLRRVDENWLEGQLNNGRTGIFPKDFVRIVLDLADTNSDSLQSSQSPGDYSSEYFPPDTYAIVLYDGSRDLDDGLLVTSGDTVTVLRKCGDLVEAMDDFGNVGFISAECLEIIGSEPDEIRSLSGAGNFTRGSLESLRSSGASVSSGFSGDSADKRISWDGDNPERENVDISQRVASLSRPSAPSTISNGEKKAKRCLVIDEIIATEIDYIAGLNAVVREFKLHPAPEGFNVNAVMTNLKEVLSTADFLLQDLRKSGELVGECFVRNIIKLRQAYTPYCQNSDAAIALLSKYKDNIELAEFMNDRVASIRSTMINCFDLASMLIKPVQRILRYPLLLSELLKVTECSHSDYIYVRDALKRLTELASSINELKRRKELVAKYRESETTSFSERLSRLSFHSVVKKSSRLGMLVSSTMGFTTLIQDPIYQAEERRFQVTKRTIKWFLRNVIDFVEQLQALSPILRGVGESFATLLKEPTSQAAPVFTQAQDDISSHLLNVLLPKVNANCVLPLENTLKQFQGPSNLMTKRHAKLIDYENAKRKLDRTRDASRNQTLMEEVELSKRVYEALNAQLLEDLPHFNRISCQILQSRIVAFQHFRRHCATQILPYASAAALNAGNKRDVPKQLQQKVTMMLGDLRRLDYEATGTALTTSSISTPSTRTDFPESVKQRRVASSFFAGSTSADDANHKPKARIQRSNTMSAASAGQFIAVELYTARSNFDLSLKKGDVVEVIKMHDPMGDHERWFVESGGLRGFVPKQCLGPQQNSLRPKSTMSVPGAGMTTHASLPKSGDVLFAVFDFAARGAHQIDLKKSEKLLLIAPNDLDGNPEWWYVENGHGRRGYVPGSYLTSNLS